MDRKKEILEAHNQRFACKVFDAEKKISDEDFNFILETGRLSPSSFGWEPWKFLVIQDVSFREKLKEVAWGAQTHLPSASHFILLMARKSGGVKAGSDYLRYIATDIQKLPADIVDRKMDFFGNFQQNDFDLTDDRKIFDWSSKQTYIPLGNMMTAAAQIGIDSCPIEGFDRDKVDSLLSEESLIDTDQFGLSVMAAFGYRSADAEISPKTRQPLDTIVEWI